MITDSYSTLTRPVIAIAIFTGADTAGLLRVIVAPDAVPLGRKIGSAVTLLKVTLDRLREATKNKDSKAKKKARDEVKKISAKMYALTAELIKKNNGKMPEGWWEKK